VKIAYGGLDDEEAISKFNSAEYGFVFIDQAEEMTRDDAGMLRGTGRLKIGNIAIPFKALWTANPAPCWLEEDFINNSVEGHKFIQALPADNEFINNDEYIKRLKEAWKHRPELIQAYIYGSWEHLAGFQFLISKEWIKQALKLELQRVKYPKILISVDPARYGDDETAIYGLEETETIHQETLFQKSTMDISARVVLKANELEADAIAIDGIGIGAGIVDRCKELTDISVIDVNSAERCENENDRHIYYNKRAEMWWKVSEMIADNKIPLPDDPDLHTQLCSVKYEIKYGRIKVEDKDEIKKRINKSPDKADAFVQGIWALPLVTKRKYETNYDYAEYYQTARRAY